MTDELTKPLALDSAGSRGIRFWPAFVILIIGLLIVMGGSYAWLQGNRPATEQAIAENEAQAVDAESGGQPAASHRSESVRAQTSGEATETERSGKITKPAPLPALERQDISLAHLPDPRLSERISSGLIPRRSPENLRPMDVYSRQPATEGNFGVARVVLIVGGLGISQTGTHQAIRQLPSAVTLAFAPYGNSLERWMQDARKSGHELLLQVPMEPIDYPANSPGKHTLLGDASRTENIANLHWLMSRFTNYVGVINYLGGKYLGNREAIKPVFDELAGRGLLFVDDGSIRNSVSDAVARASLLAYARADVRIDRIRERSKIKQALDELAARAKRTGISIGYANAFPESIAMIAEFAASAEDDGIEITPLSAIVRDPERD